MFYVKVKHSNRSEWTDPREMDRYSFARSAGRSAEVLGSEVRGHAGKWSNSSPSYQRLQEVQLGPFSSGDESVVERICIIVERRHNVVSLHA